MCFSHNYVLVCVFRHAWHFPPQLHPVTTLTQKHTHTFQPQASANTAAAVVVVVVTLLVIALGMQQRHMWEHFVVT